MRDFLKKHGFGVLAALLLCGFTLYALLDVFVIPREYRPAGEEAGETANPVLWETGESAALLSGSGEAGTEEENGADAEDGTAETEEETLSASPEITDTSYRDGKVSVTITTLRAYDTTVYAARVTLSEGESLKTALAKDTYGKNVKDTTSEIAEENGAILAVNGDFYGARNAGYVIRNGVLYREKGAGNEDLVIWRDGSFSIVNEDEVSAETLLSEGAWQVLSFGPALVEEGEIAVDEKDEVGKAMASNPRTALGILSDRSYLFVVSDGRTSESEGLSLYELAEILKSLGAETAYNLDGGGSSSMVFLGKVVNNPTTGGNTIKERSVSDIVYVGI